MKFSSGDNNTENTVVLYFNIYNGLLLIESKFHLYTFPYLSPE